MLDLKPLADSLDDYARQLRSIAEILRSVEDTETKINEVRQLAKETEAKNLPSIQEKAKTGTALPVGVGWRPLPAINEHTAPVIEAHATPVEDMIAPEAIFQRLLDARKTAPEPLRVEWKPKHAEAATERRPKRYMRNLIIAFAVLVVTALLDSRGAAEVTAQGSGHKMEWVVSASLLRKSL